MALRNFSLLSRRATDSAFGPGVANFLLTRRLLYKCVNVADEQVQVGSPRFLKKPSRFLTRNTADGYSLRGMATERAEGEDGQHLGKTKQEEAVVDRTRPNEVWSNVTKKIFNQLNTETENGNWKHYPGFPHTGERRFYSRSILELGKGFEYAVFINEREQRATCVCQFGPYLEGPPSHVHGGAVSTMLDTVMGICAHHTLKGLWVTANLKINYKSPVPLGSTALFHVKVDRHDDRKGQLSAYVTSADGRTTLCDATSLFIKLSREQVEKFNMYLPTKSNNTWGIW